MRGVRGSVFLFVFALCSSTASGSDVSSDAANVPVSNNRELVDPATYLTALRLWRTPEHVNAWIAAKFRYDVNRALLLSETQRALNDHAAVYAPDALFAEPRGVCVDLSRFAVETLREVAPELAPRYVLIEFEPTVVAGNTLRLHWVVSFQRSGMRYFFADSERPGHIAGPYATTEEYIRDYSQYRGRQIVSFRELSSYQRSMKKPARQQSREDA